MICHLAPFTPERHLTTTETKGDRGLINSGVNLKGVELPRAINDSLIFIYLFYGTKHKVIPLFHYNTATLPTGLHDAAPSPSAASDSMATFTG